jgi:pyruvate-formate lyase-activating enzyme
MLAAAGDTIRRSSVRSRFRRWRARVAIFLVPPPDISGYRRTWKRLFNLYLSRYEIWRMKTVLRSRPTRLAIEPTNVCNLRCPYCHTGAGRLARRPAMLRLEPYIKLLDEIGDYLLLVELFNWGEAMLHPQLPALIAAASTRGISTRVNTNFSIPFNSSDADRLVESGLTDLFVSVDGATQDVYERYRVGGDLARVIDNCRTLAAAKRRLARDLPRLTLQFLQFPCNEGEGEAMRRLAAQLDMPLFAVRGAVPDPEWGRQYEWPPWWMTHTPGVCPFLWGQPVLTVDGNIAPCRGVFQSFDDFTHLAMGPEEQGARSFAEAWNHERYRVARGLFHGRHGTPDERRLPCHDCPTTIFHERWRTHRAAGGTLESFDPGMELSVNGAWNYFWSRGQQRQPPGAEPRDAGAAGDAPWPTQEGKRDARGCS